METVPHLSLSENPIVQPNYKFKGYPPKTNRISIWAFILSIFIYISIFYIFNLSPSTVFNTTKFWFFISNTLILIIAADFGAFSSSRKQHLCEEEEYAKNHEKRNVPSFEFQYQNFVKKSLIPLHQEVEENPTQEKIKEVVVYETTSKLNSTQSCLVQETTSMQNQLEIVVKEDVKNPRDDFREKKPEFVPKADNEEHEEMKKNEAAKYGRSKSEKGIKFANDEKGAIVLHRSQTEKLPPKPNAEEEAEQNEFSNMSDEELNRRVEEFIQKFNRQIRLQAKARNLHHHHHP